MMEFPITELLDQEQSEQWVIEHFHPEGLKCPRCKAGVEEAYAFRQTVRSQLQVYRCKHCRQTYNLYSGTVFEQRHLTVQQAVLLLRGILKGETSSTLAAELGLHERTVREIRQAVHNNAVQRQPDSALPDAATESDEMFQNAGEKR